jgi:hypothetical protein
MENTIIGETSSGTRTGSPECVVRSFAERPIGDFTAHATACIDEAITKTFGKST